MLIETQVMSNMTINANGKDPSSSTSSSSTSSSSTMVDSNANERSSIESMSCKAIDRDQLSQLRKLVLTKCAEDPAKYDHRDLAAIETSDLFLTQCFNEYTIPGISIEAICEHTIDSLAMRKTHTVLDGDPTQFASEFYDTNALAGYEKPGEQVYVYVNLKGFTVPRSLTDYVLKYINTLIGMTVERLGDRRIILVINTAGIGYSEVELAVQLAYIAYKCYPGAMGETYVVNLHWMLKAGLQLLLTIFPDRLRSRLHIRPLADIVELIGVDRLPPFLGGTCDQLEYSEDIKPKNVQLPTLEEVGKRVGATPEVVRKVTKMISKLKHINRDNKMYHKKLSD